MWFFFLKKTQLDTTTLKTFKNNKLKILLKARLKHMSTLLDALSGYKRVLRCSDSAGRERGLGIARLWSSAFSISDLFWTCFHPLSMLLL